MDWVENRLLSILRGYLQMERKYQFIVLIEQDEDGMYIASIPALKGCHTQARSIDELWPSIREAVDLCLNVPDS